MKRLTALLLAALLCISVLGAVSFADGEDTVRVTTAEEFYAALEEDSDALILVDGDITYETGGETTLNRYLVVDGSLTIACSGVLTLTRDVVINGALTFIGVPGEGFFVKSLEIPSDATFTVNGSITTVSNFESENNIAVAQIYVNGGYADMTGSTCTDDCNICFNAGALIPPEDGFSESAEIARYIYEGYNDIQFTEQLNDALDESVIRTVVLQADTGISDDICIFNATLSLDGCWLSVYDGLAVTAGDCGTVVGNEGAGVIVYRGGRFLDYTAENEDLILTWDGEGFSAEEVTVLQLADGAFEARCYPNGELRIEGSGVLPDFDADNDTPWDDDAVTCITLGDGITGIGAGLIGWNVESVSLSGTIASMDDNAFTPVSGERHPDFSVTFPVGNDVLKQWLQNRQINYSECDGSDVIIRIYNEHGWTDNIIENADYTGCISYYVENGVLVSAFGTNTRGERTYMAFYSDGEEEPSFWVKYSNYCYEEDGSGFSVDYEAMIGGEHRVGTDYMRGEGEDMEQLSTAYVLDDGTNVTVYYENNVKNFEEHINANGERTYLAMAFDENDVPAFAIEYSNYQYGTEPDDIWSYDFDAMIFGSHRMGTDYMRYFGDDMIMVAGEYTHDDGTYYYSDYEADTQNYFQVAYTEKGGDAVCCGYYMTFGDVIAEWDLTDGNTVRLPEDTVELGSEALNGIAADKVVINSALQTVSADTFGEGTLIIIEKDHPLIPTLQELGLYILVD